LYSSNYNLSKEGYISKYILLYVYKVAAFKSEAKVYTVITMLLINGRQ